MQTAETTETSPDRDTVARALLEIRALKKELGSRPEAPVQVAVASASCRLPQANNPEEFWELLRRGTPTSGPIPRDRWDNATVYDPTPGRTGRSYAASASFIDNPYGFDPAPFGISPREAAATDPHHRLVLMCAWEALERAGIDPTSLRGTRTGVFVGMSGNDYERSRLSNGKLEDLDGITSIGSSANFAANRLSYLLGLHGPSMVVDTACSSSLVALHLARQAIQSGDCDLAVVAGVNLMFSAEAMVALSQSRMLSPTGRCHTFSTLADGYARGEGCVAMVLRRAEDVPAEAPVPMATLLATAVNQDGPTSGITVPNGKSQSALIRSAHTTAGIDADALDYIELHGTGTRLGDPIELRALADVYRARRRTAPLWIGATKPVTGHLEGAAGLVGLLKCLLVATYRTVPAQPVDGEPTGGVRWDELPFRIPSGDTAIPTRQAVSGVSSFGYGGTNAHAIVQSWARPAAPDRDQAIVEEAGHHLSLALKLSAASPGAIKDLARAYGAYLDTHGLQSAWHLCSASLATRADLTHRVSIVATTPAQLLEALNAVVRGEPHSAVIPGAPREEDGREEDGRDPRAMDPTAMALPAPGSHHPDRGLRPGPGVHQKATEENGHRTPAGSPSAALESTDRSVLPPTGPPAPLSALRARHLAWCTGQDIDWSTSKKVPGPAIPTYPWQLEDLRPDRQPGPGQERKTDPGITLQLFPASSTSGEAHAEINVASAPIIDEHIVYGHRVLPGVVFMELILRLAETLPGPTARVKSLDITRPCIIEDSRPCRLHLRWKSTGDSLRITAESENQSGILLHHATARLVRAEDTTATVSAAPLPELDNRATYELGGDEFYATLWPEDFRIGPSLALVQAAHLTSEGTIQAVIGGPPRACAAIRSGIRPGLLVLDAAIQAAGATRPDRGSGVVTLGTGFTALVLNDGADLTAGATVVAVPDSPDTASIYVYSPSGTPLASIRGVENRPVSTDHFTHVLEASRTNETGRGIDLNHGPETLVRSAIAAVLGVDASSVACDARLEDLMDSILLVELGDKLQPHTDNTLGVPELLDATTVAGLTALMTPDDEPGTATAREPEREVFDPPLRRRELTVAAMTELADAVEFTDIRAVPRDSLPPGVLLTGATGFVGSFLLHELLSSTSREVHCLVRADSVKEGRERLWAAAQAYDLDTRKFESRIRVVPGDLTEHRFGLDQEVYSELRARVGEVFHNAGSVKWTASYQQLAPHNVDGTAEVLRFATDGEARVVHFTSTVGVFSSDRVDLGEVHESVPLEDSGPLVVGYAQTKWVAELMVRRAGEQGLPHTIHRINTGPSSTSGAFNGLDHLSLIIKGCIESGLAPADGPFPVQAAPIDHVARAYVRLALDPGFLGRTSHLVNEPTTPWPEFFGHIEGYGYELERLPFEEWRAAVTGKRSGTMALLGLAPFITRTVDDVSLADFIAPETRTALGSEQPWCPPVDRDLVHTFLNGFTKRRFVNPPTT